MLMFRVTAVIAVAAAVSAADSTGAPRSGLARDSKAKAPPVRMLARIASDSSRQLRLVKPHGIAVDGAGRIFVADPVQHAIIVFDRQAPAAGRWTGNARHPLGGPAGLAFHTDGRLFATDAYKAQVVVFDAGGHAVASFGRDVLKRPAGVAVDAVRGRVYVADGGLRQVVTFDARTLSFTGPVATTKPSGRSAPANLAVNTKGMLYVTYPAECQVRAYETDGTLIHSFGTICIQPGEFARPSSIAIDREDRPLVVDAELGSLQVFSASGREVLFAGSLGRGPRLSLVRTAIALDSENRIYVAEQDSDGGSVSIFASVAAQNRQQSASGVVQARR